MNEEDYNKFLLVCQKHKMGVCIDIDTFTGLMKYPKFGNDEKIDFVTTKDILITGLYIYIFGSPCYVSKIIKPHFIALSKIDNPRSTLTLLKEHNETFGDNWSQQIPLSLLPDKEVDYHLWLEKILNMKAFW